MGADGTRLGRAIQRLDSARKIVQRQERVILLLKSQGKSTDEAERLLVLFKSTLETLEKNLTYLQHWH